jgi:hypothetical protein
MFRDLPKLRLELLFVFVAVESACGFKKALELFFFITFLAHSLRLLDSMGVGLG